MGDASCYEASQAIKSGSPLRCMINGYINLLSTGMVGRFSSPLKAVPSEMSPKCKGVITLIYVAQFTDKGFRIFTIVKEIKR